MRAGIAGLLLFVGGCSALGLSDGLDRAPCDMCDALNDIEPPDDPECESWQCTTPDDPMNGVCEIDLIDRDQDDAPMLGCETEERPADCDDDDPRNAPGLAEGCDARDNDCDGRIDEVPSEWAYARSALVPSLASQVVALAAVDGTVAAAYGAGTTPPTLAVSVLDFHALATNDVAVGTAVEPATAAVTRARTGWLVGWTPVTGCSRVRVGSFSDGGAILASDVVDLPKLAGTCPDDATTVTAPALAAVSDRSALAAWLSGASARSPRGCDRAEAVDVAIAPLTRAAGNGPFTAGEALSLGQSADTAPPATLGIDAAFGYLVAFVEASSGDVVVYRVTLDGANGDEVARAACDVECGDVGLVQSGGEIALTYRDGACAGDAAAVLVPLVVSGDAVTTGDALLGPIERGLRSPTAARREAPSEWALGWSITAGADRAVRAQRFDDAGAPQGPPLTLIDATVLGPIALLAGDGPTGGLRAYALDDGDDALTRGAASCPPAE